MTRLKLATYVLFGRKIRDGILVEHESRDADGIFERPRNLFEIVTRQIEHLQILETVQESVLELRDFCEAQIEQLQQINNTIKKKKQNVPTFILMFPSIACSTDVSIVLNGLLFK